MGNVIKDASEFAWESAEHARVPLKMLEETRSACPSVCAVKARPARQTGASVAAFMGLLASQLLCTFEVLVTDSRCGQGCF